MALADRQFGLRGGRLPFPLRWRHALGAVADVAVIPHYDAFPEPISAAIVLQAPHGVAVLGIDEETAMIGCDGTWQVRGRGRVTVWRGRERVRYRDGATFRLA
jgi:cyanophycinase-like exopeptidase